MKNLTIRLPEDMIAIRIAKMGRSDEDFERAAPYLLHKNAELYTRLA